MNRQKFTHFIEPLEKHHQRDFFSCGVDALDRYLKKQASQDMRKYITATFVLVHNNHESVIGYYTLSSTAMNPEEFPAEIIKNLPRYPLLPTTLLGRLAVDEKHKGKKLGELLLTNAFERALHACKNVASMAILVDAKDEKAISFYQRYGFIKFPSHDYKLFLPMSAVEKFLG